MAKSRFRPLSDEQVNGRSDEQVLEYVVAARAAGEVGHATRALQILVWGYRGIVAVRVGLKVPKHDVDDVADAALLRAVAAALKPDAFRGSSIGEFRRWTHTIVDRQVVDYWRRRERSVDETELKDEREGDEDSWGAVGVSEDEAAAVDVQAVIDHALGELSAEHRRSVELYVFDCLSARETAEKMGNPMTENNVHQIAKRFRTRVRELLDEST